MEKDHEPGHEARDFTQPQRVAFSNWKKDAQRMKCHAKIALITPTEIADKVYQRAIGFFSKALCDWHQLKQQKFQWLLVTPSPFHALCSKI